jgi:hypothetical protein
LESAAKCIAYHFVLFIAEEKEGPSVTGGDNAIQVLANDGIVGESTIASGRKRLSSAFRRSEASLRFSMRHSYSGTIAEWGDG